MAKILIIDDSEVVRDQLYALLKSNGHSVTAAEDGFDGLKMLKEVSDYEVIICDINMPKLDGITMLETANEENLIRDSKLFMLTTETSLEKKKRGKAIGVCGWITKPYIDEVVLSVIDKVLKGV